MVYLQVVGVLLLCFGLFGCLNVEHGRRTNAATECEDIDDFYGGDVIYFDGREIGAEVFYSCDEDFSQHPEDLAASVCTDTNDGPKWVPDPPQCLASASVVSPKHGLTNSKDDIIEHGKSYTVFCKIGYEFYMGSYYNVDSINITNNNGTLTPRVPRCKPARCDANLLNETIVYFWNGTEITDFVQSGMKVKYSCVPDFEFRNENFHNRVAGRCRFGRFMRKPRCRPKHCTIGNITTNSFSSLHYYMDDYSFLFRGFKVDHGSMIVVNCRNNRDYELYVEATQTYVNDFVATCDYGTFDMGDEEFPVCHEKRCHFKMSTEYCLWKIQASHDVCFHGEFYVPSGTNLKIGCRDGYRRADGNGDNPTIKCLYGKYSEWKPFDCEPLPCEVPDIINGTASQTFSEVESSKNVTFKCNEGHHFSDPPNADVLESTCYLGEWRPPIPLHCEPDVSSTGSKATTEVMVTPSDATTSSDQTSPHTDITTLDSTTDVSSSGSRATMEVTVTPSDATTSVVQISQHLDITTLESTSGCLVQYDNKSCLQYENDMGDVLLDDFSPCF